MFHQKIFLILISSILFSNYKVYSQSKLDIDERKKYNLIEKNAKPKGGMVKFYKYIQKKLKYPYDAQEDKIEGKVFVEFFVNEKGNIDKETIKIIRGLSPSCNAEAIRLIASSPRWIPAEKGGEPVRQKMMLSINFRLP